MNNTKHVLTKYETIRRTEKVEYLIEIPKHVKGKMEHAIEQVDDNNYISYKVVDIVESEMLDEEVLSLQKANQRVKT